MVCLMTEWMFVFVYLFVCILVPFHRLSEIMTLPTSAAMALV